MIKHGFKRFLSKFRRNERGAVTVDWVVITAGVIALGIAVMTFIETEATDLATDTGDFISSRAD